MSSPSITPSPAEPGQGRLGTKPPVTGPSAVCSSQHPTVTDTMLEVLREGGTAIDAAIAGSMVQAVVQQEMTNHSGLVTCLFYEAATGRIHELDSLGRIVPDLAPHHRVPGGKGYYAPAGTPGPMSVTPGFMPGMKAMFERFGTQPWRRLVEPAIHAAAEGYTVNSFEHFAQASSADFYMYTPSGRAHFAPDGHLAQVGDTRAQPELAHTLRALAEEGPDYFITGGWAHDFVRRANDLGWPIEVEDMGARPARWGSPLRGEHGGHEIVQLSPPDSQATFSAVVLGILRHLDITSLGHFTESPEAGYYMAHALRLAELETGFINDPLMFDDPSSTLMSDDYHQHLAAKLRASRPKVDLTKHVELLRGRNALDAAGAVSKQPTGSCELSVVDSYGNWVQLINSIQSGGIAGEVVGGVPMVGSHQLNGLRSDLSGWLTGGGAMRIIIGNTIVMKDGAPVLALGSPGNVHCTVPQMLSSILDYGMTPNAAGETPLMLPLTDDYELSIESRVSSDFVDGLARMGVLVNPLSPWDYHMGSYQMSWRTADGALAGCAGPRRAGTAAAI